MSRCPRNWPRPPGRWPGGEIVYLTEDGERLAAIVPPGYAVELEDLSPGEVLALLDEMAADQPER